ncbi:hypothetical protein HK105_206397 [Polyrhizophydium stewartii]|uniref:Ankyrin repeat protein n=1 Tax=Polyrhizophydium stewartii TaxID=2732419 RepID=A0ABR4N3T1_9FUNG
MRNRDALTSALASALAPLAAQLAEVQAKLDAVQAELVDVKSELAAVTAQRERLAEGLDGQPAPPSDGNQRLDAAPPSTGKRLRSHSRANAAPRAKPFHPGATNEWDCVPVEIQNKILKRAGVLTLWVNGRIDGAKLNLKQFKEMLRDVFELDWQGDLTTLPFDKFKDKDLSEPFWHLRTKSMHIRVKALGMSYLASGLEQAAMLHWWTDRITFQTNGGYNPPSNDGYNAARCGSVEMLKYLNSERGGTSIVAEHARLAASYGHLELLQWLAARMRNGNWSTRVMDSAVINGHLGCAKWLHENRTEGCTTAAMNGAAENGHLAVIEFLHANRTEGCTTAAMDNAAINDHLDCVKWLHENRTEGCTTKAMDLAAKNGHLAVVEFLHANRTEGCTTEAMDSAAENGDLDVVEFLHANRTEGCTSKAMFKVANNGHLHVVEFLHKNCTECNIAEVVVSLATDKRFDDIKRIHAFAPESVTAAAADITASKCEIEMLDWIVDTVGVWPTSVAISRAVKNGHLRVLAWFRRRMPQLLRDHPVTKIGPNDADAVIEWFGRDDLPAKPAEVMQLATRLNRVMVIKWLLRHQPDTQWLGNDLALARELISVA